jgi:hypothetical protein
MSAALSNHQCQLLDQSPERPARCIDPSTQQVEILLRGDDFEWVRELLGDEPDAPRRHDPRTGILYALVPEARYERFKAFFEEDPLSPSERQALLRDAGRRANWQGPEWDEPRGRG